MAYNENEIAVFSSFVVSESGSERLALAAQRRSRKPSVDAHDGCNVPSRRGEFPQDVQGPAIAEVECRSARWDALQGKSG